ncbi:uncharacterized protein LOC118410894 [Branchiostoma floridae]|uniref:Uncharacterized protein LOC118410894 n=1 Tax=Branchiostoma floridae TaxID=7739 RepID=A0A9J7KR15_BRAFL|nr:uncharacterized protein LOC118410894 [Branchiostoma floridae]
MIETEWEQRRKYLLQMDHDRRLRQPAAGPAYVNVAMYVNTATYVNGSVGDGTSSGSRQEQHFYENQYPPPRHTYINRPNPPYVNVKDSNQHNMRQYQSLVPRRR